MRWEEMPFVVKSSCKATVRDPEKIFTGWTRRMFESPSNVPWATAVLVDTAAGERWVLLGARRQPPPGMVLLLPCSPHNGAPLGYKDREALEVAASLSNVKALSE